MIALLLDADPTAPLPDSAPLREAGFTVRIAQTLPDTLDDVDVIVAHVALDLHEAIRALDLDVPVVFVISWPDPRSDAIEGFVASVVAAARSRTFRRLRRRTHPGGVNGSGSPR